MTHASEKLHVVNTGREHQRRVSGTKCAVFITTCTKARKILTVENHVHACQGENKKRRLWAPMSSIGGSVKDVVDGILSSEHPVLVKVKKICECLEESGLCWRQTLTPDQVLVHPSNRGGSLVAAQDVWRQGERILSVGLRKELMTDSIAFEVSLDETKKQKQCQANVDLCKANPRSSHERILSVSCSHRTAWLKALKAGCEGPPDKTPVQLRQGDAKSDGIQQLLQEGWEWLVLSSRVEEAWPAMPAFLQMAMNSTNANARQLSEIECAAQMAQQMRHGLSITESVKAVRQCDPVCKSYLDVIGTYVARFGGGAEMPLIHFLAKFGAWAGVTSVVPIYACASLHGCGCGQKIFFVSMLSQ